MRRKTIKNAKIRGNGSAPLLQIAADDGTVKSVSAAIMGILQLKPEPTVGVAALEALSNLCKVENVSVTGCTFTGSR